MFSFLVTHEFLLSFIWRQKLVIDFHSHFCQDLFHKLVNNSSHVAGRSTKMALDQKAIDEEEKVQPAVNVRRDKLKQLAKSETIPGENSQAPKV